MYSEVQRGREPPLYQGGSRPSGHRAGRNLRCKFYNHSNQGSNLIHVLPNIAHRILRLLVHPDFEVKVRTCGVACASDLSDFFVLVLQFGPHLP